jgi:tetratricopeptide (TPR) repeat protein
MQKRLSELLKWINANWVVLGLVFSLIGILTARLIYGVAIFQPFEEIAAKQAEYREQREQKQSQKMMVARHLKLGNYFLSNSRYKAAKEEFNQVLKLDKMNPVAQMGLFKTGVFEVFMEKEFIPEVVERQIHFILEEKSDDPHARVMYGNLYAQLEEYDKAKEQYELALKSVDKPDDKPASAYFGLGIIYENEKENNLDKALEMYEKAVALSKWNERYLNNLASVYSKKGDYENAIKNYEQILRLDFEYLLPYLEISLVHRLSGNLEMAALYQKKLATLLGDSALADLDKNKDVWVFEAQGRPAELYSTEEKKAFVLYNLSATLFILGRYTDAKGYAKRAGTIQVDQSASIKRLVAWDLERFANKHTEYMTSVKKFIETYL